MPRRTKATHEARCRRARDLRADGRVPRADRRGGGGRARLRRGLPSHGRLLALSAGGAGGGAAPAPLEVAAAGAGGGRAGLHRRLRAVLMELGPRVPAEHPRHAADLVAGVHPAHVRDHHPAGGADRGAGHAGPDRPARAVSPGLQRALVRAGHPRPLLPLHRGDRPPLRPRRHEALHGVPPRRERSVGSGTLMQRQDTKTQRHRGFLFSVPLCLCGFLVVSVAMGCRQDMHDGPRYEPLEKSDFFGDDRSARPLVEGTVARGHLHDDEALYTGKSGTAFVTTLPRAADMPLLQRGRQRFDIYCTPCHGLAGHGDGMVVRRGYRKPTSFHDDRLRAQPVGYFFDVITNGFGAMPDYAAQVAVRDRWAIVAYIRALQLSQHATLADVPPEVRPQLKVVAP